VVTDFHVPDGRDFEVADAVGGAAFRGNASLHILGQTGTHIGLRDAGRTGDRCHRRWVDGGGAARQVNGAANQRQHRGETHIAAQHLLAAQVGDAGQQRVGIGLDADLRTAEVDAIGEQASHGRQRRSRQLLLGDLAGLLQLLAVIAFDLVGVVRHHGHLPVPAGHQGRGHVAAPDARRIALVAVLGRQGHRRRADGRGQCHGLEGQRAGGRSVTAKGVHKNSS
jgi:hypothetical protein